MRTINKIRRISGKEVERTTIIKPIPIGSDDIYVKSSPVISLMQLAYSYYSDASKWWVIARANNMSDMYAVDGRILRIPIGATISYIKD